jgi:hypothetical protein
MAAPDALFAQFDADDGGAFLLSGYRRTIALDDEEDPATAFAEATASGLWLLYGHPFVLYARLRERQLVRYGTFLDSPERAFLSFSPEFFL